MKIDREFDVEKYGKKCEEIERELDGLVRAQSSLTLSIERLQLQESEELSMQEEAQNEKAEGELRLNLHETTERINNLEESRLFCSKKY